MPPESAREPTIILYSGACHTESHIRPCVPHFENAGYRVVPRPLLCAGNKGATAESTITDLQVTVEEELEAGNDVCLILHSLAGITGAEVVNRVLLDSGGPVKGKICQLVFVASFIDMAPVMTYIVSNGFINVSPANEDGIITSTCPKPKEAFFADLLDEEATLFIEALVPQTMVDTHLSGDLWQSIPKTYLLCGADKIVPVSVQEETVRKYGMGVVRKADWTHDPFVGRPKEFVAVVDGILKGI